MNASGKGSEHRYVPREGELTTDARTGRVGTVTGWDGSLLTLRGTNGDEWQTAEFRRPTPRESLVPRVAEANSRNRWGF